MKSQSINSGIDAGLVTFDRLAPTVETRVRRAKTNELAGLARLARDMIPGANVSDQTLKALCSRDRDTVFAFLRGRKVIGGAAFLYLNYRGHDALVLDEIDLHDPDPVYLAAPGEKPDAIYLWAIAGAGRSALGHVAKIFAGSRYGSADLYTRPVTDAGIRLMTGLGFRPSLSWSPDLWVYHRLGHESSASTFLQHAA